MSSNDKKCEFAFLAEEADKASAAMSRAGGKLASDLAVALSPRMFFKEHKWTILGIPAVGAGGIAAAIAGLFFLNHKRQAKRGFFSRMFGGAAEKVVDAQPRKKTPLWLLLLEPVLKLAEPAIMSAIASIVGARFAHHGNGHSPDREQVR